MAWFGKSANRISAAGRQGVVITQRRSVLVALLAGASLVLPLPAFAQTDTAGDETANPTDGDHYIEEIIVTGTRIKRRDFSSVTPIATLDMTDIQFSGSATVEELLNKMPQMAADMGRTSNNPGNGAANINLRGMGANRTLVLLNGRRIAPSGASSLVDVNNLPQALMSRVEVITGGASAIYGSDAMAGVVNFITRDDFSGLAIETTASITEEGDAEDYDVNLVYGYDLPNRNGNITAYVNYHERKPLFASERELTKVVWYDTWAGQLIQYGSGTVPEGTVNFPRFDFGNGPTRTTFTPDGDPVEWRDPEDRYNYQPVNYLQVPLKRYTGGVFANVDVSDQFNLYTELFYAQNKVEQTLAPVPATLTATVNTDNPLLTAATRTHFENNFLVAPGTAQFQFARRLTELGLRIITTERDYWRGVIGLRGEAFDGWDLDAWVTYTDSSDVETVTNGASGSRILQGLMVDPLTNQCFDPSNGCVPVDPFGAGRISPEAQDFIRFPAVTSTTDRTQISASAVLTGSPIELWAGPLDVALGIDWRSDEASYEADPALQSGDALGLAPNASISGTERVTEVYLESYLPLAVGQPWAEYMALESAVRFSTYDNAGDVWTYKIGGEWVLFPELRLRVMQQRSVRAPNNAELFREQSQVDYWFVGNMTFQDPCSASANPVANGNAQKCVSQGLDPAQLGIYEASPFYPTRFIDGGNPDLEPETADTFTLGGVFQPNAIEGLTISVDFFKVDIEDTIGGIAPQAVCFDPLNTDGLFCNTIKRDGTGNVYEVSSVIQNRGRQGTKGVDTQVNFRTALPSRLAAFDGYATLTVNASWTHMMENEAQENPVTQVVDCAGRIGWPCNFATQFGALSEDKVTTNFNYASGPFQAHLTWRFVGRAENAAQIGANILGWGTINPGWTSVDPYHQIDLGLSWDFNEDVSVRLNVTNLFEADAPNIADSGVNNTDPGTYDVFGRTYALTVTARF